MRKLISAAFVRQMMTPVHSAAGAPLPCGLGWFIQEEHGHELGERRLPPNPF